MKLGTDSRIKTGFALVLGIVAILLLVRTYFGGSNQPATAAAPKQAAKATTKAISSLDPTLRIDLLRTSEDTKYEGKGRNIFMAQAEPLPEVKTPVIQKTPEAIVDNTPPPPPPIDMKFIGFANKPGQPKQVFLMQKEDVFVAKEGEIVNRRYKVVKINNNNVEIEDVLNNNRQSIPLSQS